MNDHWKTKAHNRERVFVSQYLGEPHVGMVRNEAMDRMNHALLGMLARTRGVGKTHYLASYIRDNHLEDGYLICFNGKEADRVRRQYGIHTVSVEDSTYHLFYSPRVPFVDPECLGKLIGLHQHTERDHYDQYLRVIRIKDQAIEKLKAEARKQHLDLLAFVERNNRVRAIGRSWKKLAKKLAKQ